MSRVLYWRLDGRKVSGLMVMRWIGGGMGRRAAETGCKEAIAYSAVKLPQTFECGACHTWKSEWCLQLIN